MGKIKLSYMVATPDVAVRESVTALQGDLETCFRMVRDAGYQGVELMTRDPELSTGREIEHLASVHALDIPMVCTGEMYGQDHLSFMDPDPEIRGKAIERTCRIIDMSARFGAMINIGRLRGRFYKNIPPEKSLEWMYSAFLKLSDYASFRNVTIALEPIEYLDCNNINSIQDGVSVVKKVNRGNFMLMADIFQMNLEEKTIHEAFCVAASCLAHIHLCDSNRRAPGAGNFNFKKIWGWIEEIEYRGFVSIEVLQLPDAHSALHQSISTLRPYLKP